LEGNLMAYDPYKMNPYFQAQYPSMYQMPAYDPNAQQGQSAPQSIMTTTPQFGYTNGMAEEGFGYGASDPTETGPSVVNTTGQFDLGGFAHGIGSVVPGGSFTNAFGKLAQAVDGPFAVIGEYANARPGTPEWAANIAAFDRAHGINNDMGSSVSSSRSVSSGASRGRGGISDPSLGRSAANRGGGAEGRGGNTRDNEGKSSADRHSRGNY
jgi:hypothetical protein